MRLLNTKTHELQEFFEDQIPEYVILSHRWSDDEITFKDFRKGRKEESIGHRKIMEFCAFARSRVWDWLWVDTICIDKRSSAELSEAINSMWHWYENARECYVYLVDVPSTDHGRDQVLRRFKQSDWFTRGWTLQEMLAPPNLAFCNVKWELIGSRESLAGEIEAACGVSTEYLMQPNGYHWRGEQSRRQTLKYASVARKMSWMAKRRNTRSEDQAYSLLGLFGVHMSLLYGEGGNAAFKRLQLEIIKISDDETVFAWGLNERQRPGLVLADSPQAFEGCGVVTRQATTNASVAWSGAGWDFLHTHRKPYYMTNKGLQIYGHAYTYKGTLVNRDSTLVFLLPLLCFRSGSRCVMVLEPNDVGFSKWGRVFTQEELDVLMPESKRAVASTSYFLIRDAPDGGLDL